ncbi:serine/threonine-protein kinase TOUSLED-like isoform X1 [Zingiber officinale]|uniref:serine/threonine-protein kinase TOUSLED-like isoform X1 n=2 Tax=Zingiber officinale TaxID=94328 RepID=UPI001C4BB964|nr:serine/threonine-protein kinase TOUSLED-like isoform X1 [Zingiber officinale]XP_042451663.1 serine/threonine-protein kinase TOUSLED-like isoform X1 [Zingiber officinale]
MSDDIVMQLSSNSNPSDPSLPTKLAKLEARMAGKSSSSLTIQSAWQSTTPPIRFPEQEELLDSSSSDDDNGEEFLIQHNTQKRQRLEDSDHDVDLEQSKEKTNGRMVALENFEIRRYLDEPNKRKKGRGRGRPSAGRGRGSKTSEQTCSLLTSTEISSNGHHEDPLNKEEISVLRGQNASLEEELNKSRHETFESQHLAHKFEKELKELKEHNQQMKIKRIKVISDLLISVSKAERQETRMKVRQESVRLGNVGVIRTGTIISEAWEDGQALKDLNAHLKSLLEMRELIERHRKSLKKKQPDKGDGSDVETGMSDEDLLLQDEICKSRLASIKREEESCLKEKDRYELEKARLVREMKRIRDEDGSRFNNFPILNQRYALLNLLGKGGFSEVYKAFDLVEYRYVACKLHGLNGQWSEEKKQSYIRHAIREYNIHKTLVHPNIVRLWDIFEIDHNTFCTVLEYCSGKDLDAVLRTTPILPEREAKIIIVQIFHGLVYLNKRPQKIIHYDLKPGNVLFDEAGLAKVTDFGLSKIVEDDVGSQGMELTSQGAGTYWYLPPECFDLSKTPLISSKVDVWSAGVILYQMLFGKRPFGHNQTQERILREETIINARKVDFPLKPSVSNEAKELIRRCLTYDQAERPDVLTVAQDPYLSYSKR